MYKIIILKKYWVKNMSIFNAILNIDANFISQDWQPIFYNRTVQELNSAITYPKIRTFHSVVLLPKNHDFFCKKS
jgi:hypothetical protein